MPYPDGLYSGYLTDNPKWLTGFSCVADTAKIASPSFYIGIEHFDGK